MGEKLSHIKTIAVLRANALGDFIFSIPAFYALRESYPKAKIILLGRKWHKEFLQYRPFPIDEVIVVPPVKGVSMNDEFTDENKIEIKKFFKKIKKRKFDVAIQLHGGGKFSNPFIKNIGAKLTIGMYTSDSERLDRNVPYIYYQNETLRLLEVVSLIGAKTRKIYPRIFITNKDKKETKKVICSQKPFIVLHPGASDIKRRWNPKKFSALGDSFYNMGFEIYVTGVVEEVDIVTKVVHSMQYPSYAVCGNLGICGLVGLLAQASLVVSNDTGPLHLATALGIKTVGLYWCGNLINGDPLRRETHRPVLSWDIYCPFCKANCAREYPFTHTKTDCSHQISFLESITVEEVIIQALALLEL